MWALRRSRLNPLANDFMTYWERQRFCLSWELYELLHLSHSNCMLQNGHLHVSIMLEEIRICVSWSLQIGRWGMFWGPAVISNQSFVTFLMKSAGSDVCFCSCLGVFCLPVGAEDREEFPHIRYSVSALHWLLAEGKSNLLAAIELLMMPILPMELKVLVVLITALAIALPLANSADRANTLHTIWSCHRHHCSSKRINYSQQNAN